MKCPACKRSLREKSVSGLTVDFCYGGCGGIWFDYNELNRIDNRGAAALHAVWRDPHNLFKLTEPRNCPRCPNQVLDRRWFSDQMVVQVDVCPSCSGIWLDEGEFSAVDKEVKAAKFGKSCWQSTIALIATMPPDTSEQRL
ncbi:MAG: zf-TFIIB domain-containing protein [Verrucomicrobiales bacterium]